MARAAAKRTLEELANKSDSNDDDYSDSKPRSRRSAASRPRTKKRPPKKRKRNTGNDTDESEISLSEEDLSVGSPFEDDEEDSNVERNARGSVRRAAAKKAAYHISSSDEDDDEGVEEPDEDSKPAGQKQLLLKLNLRPPQTARPSRTTRARSAGLKDTQPSVEVNRFVKRTTRRTYDESEDIVALTNSGNHVQTVRRATRSPEATTHPRREGAGFRGQATAPTIEEEEEEAKLESGGEGGTLPANPDALEIMESDPQSEFDDEDAAIAASDNANPTNVEPAQDGDLEMADEGFVPESQPDQQEDEDDEDEAPRSSRRARTSRKQPSTTNPNEEPEEPQPTRRSTRKRTTRGSQQPKDDGSDFEPNEEEANEDDLSASEVSQPSPRKGSQGDDEAYESSNGRRSRLRKRQSQSRPESEAGELAEELAELKHTRPRRRAQTGIIYEEKPRRNRKSVDYRLIRPELILPIEEAENEVTESPSRRPRGGGGGGWQRSLLSTYGPFGGGGGPPPLLGGPSGMGAAGGADSDSSDDEAGRPKIGGATGMTPTSAVTPGFGLAPAPQTYGTDAVQGLSGTPANLGKVKDKQALADSDPLGIDPNVNFDSVGGLQGHIDQLKEMVSLPLLYPEIFQRFHIVPPRGVLFHGPPGTGKTLLARALASSVSSNGRKVTFYMRKGADALSKWVGEAERQLRLLFDEARKNQPSIIFFDEIDGLAPVRSSKQEQIHASIVSTLLALMDGMDGRGQVIVIGATNRPDSIDPALRRPGRFDREFYFPLPNTEARRAILEIHTKGWNPPLSNEIKDELAKLTKGYGGADLRALCTEAALNAVQRRYPQIYRSNEKLLIDPKTIEVHPKDFMMCIKKLVPSSERSVSSGATPLPGVVEPLLRDSLQAIQEILAEILPQKKRLTALEEAQFEEPNESDGFRRERMQQAFEVSRVFRPRLLIRGRPGMGQHYIAAALLNHFEGLHVQSFDLPTLLSDSTRSPEATIVQLFTEVKRHKPSVIYIPNVQTWYETMGQTVISTFLGLLRSLPPTDPVLLLGVLEEDGEELNTVMLKNFFGISKKTRYELKSPESPQRHGFFQPLIKYIETAPNDFPDPENRKKRKLEPLEIAPAPPAQPVAPSKEQLKAQKKKDRQTLNFLKIRIQPIMDEIKKHMYKRFRTPVIDESQIRYLYEDEDPNIVTTDLPLEQRTTFRPFEKDVDKYGVPGLREVVSGKFYYNLEIVTIEKRLSNGYYKRAKDFLADIKRLSKDARTLGDQERLLKANELLTNVEVDIGLLEQSDPALATECENVYQRELAREKEALEKAKRAAESDGVMGPPPVMNVAHGVTDSSNQSSGPVVLGEPFTAPHPVGARPVTPHQPANASTLTNGYTPRTGSEANYQGNRPTTSNGSVVSKAATDIEGDVQMSNSDEAHLGEQRETQESSFGQSAQPRPPHSYTAPSQQLRQQSGLSNLSQKGTMTPMAPGSQPGDYANDASTTQTTSDKKNSGPSYGQQLNTQSSVGFSGRHDGPDLQLHPDRLSGDEPLPDTQQESAWGSSQQTPLTGILEFANSQHSSLVNGSQSQPLRQSQPGSQPPVLPFDGGARQTGPPPAPRHPLHDLLNNEDHPKLIINERAIEELHRGLTSQTDGFSIEQLEQMNTQLMDTVWKLRSEWDRGKVAEEVKGVLEEVLMDMRSSEHLDMEGWSQLAH
ncbi:hypothetical protein AJ80_04468 [Polytolypa hystricis UAMH7299]|uniref:Bromo domain-containing protein n=1 Tax=Polytolypa hystricis (strain UAMH7299) TaxID=1447883 RepID=A0A2B7YC68_POLH7|nr:hypothetical protein AJ80_04468 [Polytolypa hystricis UAMH7299]